MLEPHGLNTSFLGRSFVMLDEVDSTNEYLKREAGSLPHGTAVIACRQTAGKGRLGRVWEDVESRGLYLSFLLKDVDAASVSPLPLLTALGVRAGLSALYGADLDIKWSNDILCGGKKVCGILCEGRVSSGSGRGFAVVGIGVNLSHSRTELERLGLVYATSMLLETDKLFSPLEAAAAILNAAEPVLARGFEPLREEYRRHCVTLGKAVRVLEGGREQDAFALDIAPDGSLVCRFEDAIHNVHAGEASVRGLLGYV